jgi:hypothetical protein
VTDAGILTTGAVDGGGVVEITAVIPDGAAAGAVTDEGAVRDDAPGVATMPGSASFVVS